MWRGSSVGRARKKGYLSFFRKANSTITKHLTRLNAFRFYLYVSDGIQFFATSLLKAVTEGKVCDRGPYEGFRRARKNVVKIHIDTNLVSDDLIGGFMMPGE